MKPILARIQGYLDCKKPLEGLVVVSIVVVVVQDMCYDDP